MVAPGERVPMCRDERNPGITFSYDSSAGFSRRKRCALDDRSLLRPFRARNISLTDRGAARYALAPGYYFPPLRGWLSAIKIVIFDYTV